MLASVSSPSLPRGVFLSGSDEEDDLEEEAGKDALSAVASTVVFSTCTQPPTCTPSPAFFFLRWRVAFANFPPICPPNLMGRITHFSNFPPS